MDEIGEEDWEVKLPVISKSWGVMYSIRNMVHVVGTLVTEGY